VVGDGIFLIQNNRLTEFASQAFETEDVGLGVPLETLPASLEVIDGEGQ
jgi:hypothetical protein